MRIGQNPLKNAPSQYSLENVVIAVVTHLPNTTTAYHSKRLEVVQTCLESMRAGIHHDHTFMVWDNGSMPELREWLQWDFKPDCLMLSQNIGKISARTMMARMLPADTVMAYSDDDMLFVDDWLAPQLELLTDFPNVACVSGYPVRTAFRWGIKNTVNWAQQNAKLEKGIFISDDDEADFAVSVGRTPEWHKEYTQNDVDYRITYQGKQAYATAHHCQFIAFAGTVAQVSRFDHMATGDEKPFDIAMDKIGLRLSTTKRLARHVGNVLDDQIRQELFVVQEKTL